MTVSFGRRDYALVDLVAGLDDQLRDAIVVRQIDEVNAAVVAAIAQPSGEANVGSYVRDRSSPHV